jgi:phytoene/squalene synthetase
MATIRHRLDEFYRRLAAAPPARTADEALELICRMLDEVEDDMSGIPKETPPSPL